MNPNQVGELLERAADSVTPAEPDPAGRLVTLGRRRVRRRRAWTAAAAVLAVVALPFATVVANRLPDVVASDTTVSFDGLSVVVPAGWRISREKIVDTCTAEPRTVYLAERWENSAPLTTAPGSTPFTCRSEGQAWMALVQHGPPRYVTPERLLVKDGQLLQVSADISGLSETYIAFTNDLEPTGVVISGDAQARKQLLDRVTWPGAPSAPPSGGLVLPDEITSAVSARPNMINATDARTLSRIRAKLAALQDPVPAGEECALEMPGAVGISLGEITVVLGDASCPQAISTGGGRVRAPAGLGMELHNLIAASERAAVERKKKKD
ncbi:hypothetical protein OHA21_21715 [Actinoplanes sp. NBC_00393]|uniref:hypothetical protein n=1 Tax=Actinoplanes sp. NBC_00393 TaxID=2975953 RepID=UPI002E224EFE